MQFSRTNVLILGGTGMLGNAMLRLLAADPDLTVIATSRSSAPPRQFPPEFGARLIGGVDVQAPNSLEELFAARRPDVVINCVGLIKQLSHANRVLSAVPINTLLPHRLTELCQVFGTRLIHISTDCVFSGEKGNYVESDRPDATDVYGLSKFLGEVLEPNAITLRTSIIGPELSSSNGLLCWFLAQQQNVKGYRRAIFSGLPTVELASVIRENVIPRPDLTGLYHVSAAPIAKFDLLKLISQAYGKEIGIDPDDSVVIDRSLDSTKFKVATGYQPPSWPQLIAKMRQFG